MTVLVRAVVVMAAVLAIVGAGTTGVRAEHLCEPTGYEGCEEEEHEPEPTPTPTPEPTPSPTPTPEPTPMVVYLSDHDHEVLEVAAFATTFGLALCVLFLAIIAMGIYRP